MDAMQILVVILSVFLALFLILGIVLTVMLIKVTQQIKQISVTAKDTVEKVGHFATNAAKLSSPSFLVDTVLNTIKRVRNNKEDK